MSRQNTDQLYIEIDYFTPEEYFVFTAEAQSQQAVSSSLNCASSKITQAQATLVVSASISATISHIEGADLFAFSEAAIAVQVDRIRETNIAASIAFDIATSVERIQQGDADADAIFSAIINGLRSRDAISNAEAAFSFECEATLIQGTGVTVEATASFTSEFAQTVLVNKIIETNSVLNSEFTQTSLAGKSVDITLVLSSQFTQTASVNRLKDIDLFAFSQAAIAIQVDIIRDNNASLTSVFDISTDGRRFRDIASDEDAEFNFDLVNQRIRAFTIETQAAFSISAANDRIRSATSSNQITATVSATISHIEGADIVLDNFGTLTCSIDDRVRDQSVSMQAQFAQTTINRRVRFAVSSQLAQLFQTAESRRIRFGSRALTVVSSLTAVVEKYKTFGRTTISASTALSATGIRAPRDNEYPKIQTRALLHMDSEPIVDEYTSTIVNATGGTVYSGKFGNAIGQPISAIPYITNANGLFTNLIYQPAWTIDFWFQAPILTYNYVSPSVAIFAIKAVNDREDYNWTIAYSQTSLPTNGSSGSVNGRFASEGAQSPQTTYTFNTTTDGSVSNEWRHVAVTFEYLGERPAQGEGYYEIRTRVWVNGQAGVSANQIISIDNTSNALFLFPTLTNVPDRDGLGSFTRTFRGRVDEIRFQQGIAYTADFTPPSQAYDPYLYYKQGSGILDTRALLSANVLNIQFGAASLAAQFNRSITGARTRLGTANLSVIASRLVIATEVNRTTADLATQTQMTVNGVKVTFLFADTAAVFNQSTDNIRIRFGNSQVNVNTNLTVDADVVGSGRINVSAQFNQTTLNQRFRDVIPQLDSIASQLTVAARNATGTILLESVSALNAIATRTARDQIAVQANTELAAINSRFRSNSSQHASEFSLSTDGERIQPAGAEFSSTTALTVNTANSKITRVSAQLSTDTNLSASADRSRDIIVLQASAGTLTCDNQVLRLAQATLNAVTEIIASPTFIVRIEAEFIAFNTQLTVGDVLNLDPALTYLIPQETREYQIIKETREYIIAQETRELIIIKG